MDNNLVDFKDHKAVNNCNGNYIGKLNDPDNKDEMMCITDWDWCDFKLLYDTVVNGVGEENAWKLIHQVWQLRAGEINDIEVEQE